MQTRLTHASVLSLVSLLSISITPIAAQSNTTLNTTSLNLPYNSSTLGIPNVPPNFHVDSEIGGPKLNKTSCLMITVEALKQLALLESDAPIADDTEYKLEAYPVVSILVNTRVRQSSIKASYVLWAIALGIHEIISENKFELAQFQISLGKQLVGWVHMVDNAVLMMGGESAANQTLDVIKRATLSLPQNVSGTSSGNLTNIESVDITNDPSEVRLRTEFTPFGTSLGLYDVFFPIVNALTQMAAIPSTAGCQLLVAGYEGKKGVFCILPAVPVHGGATNPPVLEYQWLIRTMGRVLAYMFKNGRLGELEIKIALDGVEIAVGRLSNVDDVQSRCATPSTLG